MGSPKVRAIFSCEFALVVSAAFAEDRATLQDVRTSLEDDARRELDKLAPHLAKLGIRLPPEPKLVRLILDEPEVPRG